MPGRGTEAWGWGGRGLANRRGLATAAPPVDRPEGYIRVGVLSLSSCSEAHGDPTPPALCAQNLGGGPGPARGPLPRSTPWGLLGLRAQGSRPSTACWPPSHCLLKARQLLGYLHTCRFQKESFHKGCFVPSEHVGPGASVRPRPGPCPWGVGSNLGVWHAPLLLRGWPPPSPSQPRS